MLGNCNLRIIYLKYILSFEYDLYRWQRSISCSKVQYASYYCIELHRNKSYGPCCGGQIGCDTGLLEAGTDPDRLAAWPQLSQSLD